MHSAGNAPMLNSLASKADQPKKQGGNKTTTNIGNILVSCKPEQVVTESFLDNIFEKKVKKNKLRS